MKLEDVKVGQTVVDKFGNEYVVEILGSDSMPVNLRLTKFVKHVVVQKHGLMFKYSLMFDSVDDCFWIYKSEKVAKKNGTENCITVESLKLKESKRKKQV